MAFLSPLYQQFVWSVTRCGTDPSNGLKVKFIVVLREPLHSGDGRQVGAMVGARPSPAMGVGKKRREERKEQNALPRTTPPTSQTVPDRQSGSPSSPPAWLPAAEAHGGRGPGVRGDTAKKHRQKPPTNPGTGSLPSHLSHRSILVPTQPPLS